MSEEVRVTVSIPSDSLAEIVSRENKPHEINDLVSSIIRQVCDEHMTWTIVAECLEHQIVEYAGEAEWYTERELKETFEEGGSGRNSYAHNRNEALEYLRATRLILSLCRHVLSGKPELVRDVDGVF